MVRAGKATPQPFFLKGGRRELYNLQSDLSETRDVVAENSDNVGRLTKLMESTIATGRSTPGTPQQNDFALSLDRAAKPAKKTKN